MKNNQHVHFTAILGNIGLILHVPALMALVSIVIALIFKETFSYLIDGCRQPVILVVVVQFRHIPILRKTLIFLMDQRQKCSVLCRT